ncbi:MAG: M56 family metallopeptidase [Oscillospiraceae bacterium]
MEAIFLKVLNMSMTASYVIVAVLLLRLLLRKMPKKISYLLWSAVAFRLCCPVSWQSVFSLFSLAPRTTAIVQVTAGGAARLDHIPNTVTAAAPQAGASTAVTVNPGEFVSGSLPAASAASPDPLQLLITIGTVVWCAGMAALLIYSIVCYVKMCRQMRTAVLLRDNIYQSDRIRSPFLLGFAHPKIYIPFGLKGDALNYVLEHERYHIRRRDYLVKPFAFLLLTVHWFNPLCWLSFHLVGRDMEMSCDEKVIAGGRNRIKAYSTTLLSFAVSRRFPAPSPLSFGETSVKSRIKNVLNWRKPKTWATLLASLLCILAVVACAANPEQKTDSEPDSSLASDGAQTGQYSSMEEFAEQAMAVADGSYFSASTRSLTAANVLETKLDWLEKTGEVSALAPNGTLESWRFGYLVQIDADADDIALPGGMHEEDGWYDLEGQGGHNVVALRYEDGSYDVLYDEPVNDGMDFFGYHYSYEEAIYDWYVEEYGLDLPLYVIDLLPFDELGTHPAHRYDGDGWYIYIPVQAWELTEASETQTVWSSQYGTGSTLTVKKVSDSEAAAKPPALDGLETAYYDTSTGIWCVSARYDSENITDYPYIAIEPVTLAAMAESFTADARFASTDPRSSAANPETETLTGYITIRDGQLLLDEIEIITPEDTGRMEELGLTLQGDLVSGYYLYNEEESTQAFQLTDNTEYRFVDINRLYTTYDGEGSLNYATTSLEEFIEGSGYGDNAAAYEASLESGEPCGRIPYFVEIRGNTVVSVTQEFGSTL